MNRSRAIALVLALTGIVTVAAAAAVAADGSAPWWRAVAGGGGSATSSGNILAGTIGQPLTGSATGTDLRLVAGFWGRSRSSAPTPDGTPPTPGSPTPVTPETPPTAVQTPAPTSTPSGPGHWLVNSTNDAVDGTCDLAHCSLREAIRAANAHSGPDLIAFAIPSDDPGCDAFGICTIQLAQQLTELTDPATTIDGFSQPGAQPNSSPVGEPIDAIMRIVLDGSLIPESQYPDGLNIRSSDNVVRGLVIHGFGDGIKTTNVADNRIEGNFVGVSADGLTAPGNRCVGIALSGTQVGAGSTSTIIGGTAPAARNLIAGNGCTGISIGPPGNNVVEGNYVGTDATGRQAFGNAVGGVRLFSSSGNVVGGETAAAANVIAFNDLAGVIVDAQFAPAVGNTLSRNAIRDNDGRGIELRGDANTGLASPEITEVVANTLSGTACAACVVEVFSDNEGEGGIFEGVAVADSAGHWALFKPGGFAGPNLTSTATDTGGNTSGFSAPISVAVSDSGVWLPWAARRTFVDG